MRHAAALLFGLLSVPILTPSVALAETPAITEDEAHSIGVDAYLYFYPLISMDVTRKQLTNMEPGPGSFGGPMTASPTLKPFPAPMCAWSFDRILIRSIPVRGSI